MRFKHTISNKTKKEEAYLSCQEILKITTKKKSDIIPNRWLSFLTSQDLCSIVVRGKVYKEAGTEVTMYKGEREKGVESKSRIYI